MKTILDNEKFRKAFKKHILSDCAHCQSTGRLALFYYKSVIANLFSFFRKPKVYLKGDLGDEIFDSVYSALEDIGLRSDKKNEISPYDVVEMKVPSTDIIDGAGNIIGKNFDNGMTVEWKEFDLF